MCVLLRKGMDGPQNEQKSNEHAFPNMYLPATSYNYIMMMFCKLVALVPMIFERRNLIKGLDLLLLPMPDYLCLP